LSRFPQVKDPEKYNFNPKQLLSQICLIYLHMAAADRAGVFAAAIAADGRSYRPEMFAEASLVLRQFGLLPEMQVGGVLLSRTSGPTLGGVLTWQPHYCMMPAC